MLEARPGPATRRGDAPARSTADERPGGDGAELVCAACEHRITTVDARVERGGAHEHTFVNPGGFVHHVGCYAIAPGCVHIGAPDPAFSWFPGWTWQIAECGRCRIHLGWIFRCAGEQFHALLVGRLRTM